jgi:hypothetical protein
LREKAIISSEGQMHCPKCGHQQSGNDVKYCPRCGFYLGMVSELLMLDGGLPGRAIAPPPSGPSARKKKIRQGAKFMFFSVVIFIFALVVGLATETPELLLFPLFLSVGSLLWMIYHRLFTEPSESPVQFPRQVQAPPQRPMLRPEDDHMRFADPRRANTGDMAHPPSVVDHTTQLFDKE